MPTVAITETEINPAYVAGGGGGLKTLTETEVNPTYFGEGGGGWHAFTVTELSPVLPAPAVTTDPALWIGPLSATLDGTLDSGGGIEPCDCGFEWGETVAYGNTTPTQRRTAGQTFAQTITGLDRDKTYHFRAFVTNGIGTAYGDDETFITPLEAEGMAGLNPALGKLIS